jgi:hypothetical protein
MLLGEWIHILQDHDAFIFKGLGNSLTLEDKGIMILLNFGNCLLSNTPSHPGRLKSSAISL